jgi:hypothetical protein
LRVQPCCTIPLQIDASGNLPLTTEGKKGVCELIDACSTDFAGINPRLFMQEHYHSPSHTGSSQLAYNKCSVEGQTRRRSNFDLGSLESRCETNAHRSPLYPNQVVFASIQGIQQAQQATYGRGFREQTLLAQNNQQERAPEFRPAHRPRFRENRSCERRHHRAGGGGAYGSSRRGCSSAQAGYEASGCQQHHQEKASLFSESIRTHSKVTHTLWLTSFPLNRHAGVDVFDVNIQRAAPGTLVSLVA